VLMGFSSPQLGDTLGGGDLNLDAGLLFPAYFAIRPLLLSDLAVSLHGFRRVLLAYSICLTFTGIPELFFRNLNSLKNSPISSLLYHSFFIAIVPPL